MTHCYVALGGNVGSVGETIETAIQLLGSEAELSVSSVSSVYRTSPVGRHAGGDFQNAAIAIETELAPCGLFDVLQSVETKLGRTREIHWGPRILDLDLIFFGNQIVDTPRLKIPHPACWYRRFVLDPLVEIAANVVHPQKGATVEELRSRLLVRPFRFSLAGADHARRLSLIEELSKQFPQVEFSEWPNSMNAKQQENSGQQEPTLLVWLGLENSSQQSGSTFDALPLLSRLDASQENDPVESFLCHVLQSAAAEDPVD